jgi:XTP/dITP diphosphohydrolase
MTLFLTTRTTDGANAPMANATTLAIASDHRLIILLRDIERTSRGAEGVEVEDYTRGLELLIASTNPGKVREIQEVLSGLSVTLHTLADLPPVPEPSETGRTFADNALLKARYYAQSSRLLTVAEDSGLVIDALDGRPGVRSARYPGATYAEKFAGLYAELAPHPRPWTARFVCSLAFVSTPNSGSASEAPLFTCEATVEGEIAPEPVGSFGFGYDPIFYYPPYGTTLGNVADERKLAVAHRGKAFREFRQWLMSGRDRTLSPRENRPTSPD